MVFLNYDYCLWLYFFLIYSGSFYSDKFKIIVKRVNPDILSSSGDTKKPKMENVHCFVLQVLRKHWSQVITKWKASYLFQFYALKYSKVEKGASINYVDSWRIFDSLSPFVDKINT